jgi:hypothetical protein
VLTDYMAQGHTDSGKYVDQLWCNSKLARCMHRLNRSESSVNVVVNSTTRENMPALGSQMAKTFLRPDGVEIPINVSETIPPNCLYGICTEDLQMHTVGNFQNWNPIMGYDGVWAKSYADRYDNLEAPFGGYMNVVATARNSHFVVLDLRDNIG